MKVYLMTDLEGVAGSTNRHETRAKAPSLAAIGFTSDSRFL